MFCAQRSRIFFGKDVLDLWYSGYFLFTDLENTKKKKRLSKEEIKKELINSMVKNDIIETGKLNEKADNIEKTEDAAAVIQAYENIRTKTKGIICIAYQQGKVFKRFKDK